MDTGTRPKALVGKDWVKEKAGSVVARPGRPSWQFLRNGLFLCLRLGAATRISMNAKGRWGGLSSGRSRVGSTEVDGCCLSQTRIAFTDRMSPCTCSYLVWNQPDVVVTSQAFGRPHSDWWGRALLNRLDLLTFMKFASPQAGELLPSLISRAACLKPSTALLEAPV